MNLFKKVRIKKLILIMINKKILIKWKNVLNNYYKIQKNVFRKVLKNFHTRFYFHKIFQIKGNSKTIMSMISNNLLEHHSNIQNMDMLVSC